MSKQHKWNDFFSVEHVKPGPVFHPATGKIDLSNENIPVEKVKKLYDTGCSFVKPTKKGLETFYPERVRKTKHKTEKPQKH